jgi:tetratricopeptide (TPR) repeat protein
MSLGEMFYLEWREGSKEYEGQSPFEQAVRHVRRAIELDPRRARYHHFLARLCYEMSGEEKSPPAADDLRRLACAEYEQAQKLFPTRATYAADLAFTYDALGRRQEAQALYAKALELDDLSRPERYLAKLSPETRREIEARLAEGKP